MGIWKEKWLYAKAEEVGNFGHWTRDLERDEGDWSEGMLRIFGISREQFRPSYEFFMSFIHPEDRDNLRYAHQAAILHGEPLDTEYRITRPDGIQRYVHATGEVVRNERGEALVLFGIVHDVTERKNSELERERLIDDLRKAVASIQRQNGLLPICAYCKKVRNDKDYWQQIESYIHEHAGTAFTHGVCPDCLQKVRGEYFGKKPG